MRNPNTLWASHPAAQLFVLYISICISSADEPLSRQKSKKPFLAPSQLAIHTQLEKLELSHIICITKSRATLEGKVCIKVSKVVLINVQSHQAWCMHLRSTTENSPWGGSLCSRQDKVHCRAGAVTTAKGLPKQLYTTRSTAVGSSPTQAQWDFQILSAGLNSRVL